MEQITKFWVRVITLCCLAATSPAQAQIASDDTLGPERSTIKPVNIKGLPSDRIDGGARRGVNLFHSFREFNIGRNQRVYFTNPDGVKNILSRVTGDNHSNILGTLGVTKGDANLFLLNPNGIIFGPNASLDIGGSFVASTASSLNFAGGTWDSATDPQTTPLLTVSVPTGLQFGRDAGSIKNQSKAPNSDSTLGLQVQQGKTLALVGGDVELEGGSLQAPGGRVELGGVAEAGTVELNLDDNNLLKNLIFPAGVARADVSLTNRVTNRATNRAFVNVTAGGGGSIAINAQNLSVLKGSSLSAGIASGQGSVDSQAGDITLNAKAITVAEGSSISNTLEDDQAQGKAGNINITTGLLSVNSALLSTDISGEGEAGDIFVDASDSVSLENASTLSSIVKDTAKGDGGTITIMTGSLSVTNATLSVSTFGEGDAGSIAINARDKVSFVEGSRARSRAGKEAEGNGGTIDITTGSLVLTKGARLVTTTQGKGDAGSVKINARDKVSLEGGAVRISSRGEKGATGSGGTIDITTGSLSVTNGARIAVGTTGKGNAGRVTINAETVSLEGMGQDRNGNPSPSGIFGNVGDEGRGGNITLNATNLNLIDGAGISATTASGDGGNITLQIQELLQLRRGSSISTTAGTAEAGGDGGTINIDAPLIFAVPSENSDISANAFTGNGGSVEVTTQGIFGIEFREETTSLSDITASSEFGVSGTVNINTLDIDPRQGLVALPEEVFDASGLIAQGCSAGGETASKGESRFVVTGRGGLPPNPSQPLSSDTVLADWVTLDPKVETPRSDPAPSMSQASPTLAPIVEAQGWVRGSNGKVILTAQAPTVTPHSSRLAPADCYEP